jgi:hypothetical protein
VPAASDSKATGLSKRGTVNSASPSGWRTSFRVPDVLCVCSDLSWTQLQSLPSNYRGCLMHALTFILFVPPIIDREVTQDKLLT